MKNTLIIGIAGAGKTMRLKELLNELPSDVNVTLYEDYIEGDFTKLLSRTVFIQPSLLVIESINSYNNLSVPSATPVYATMQATNIENAKQILNNQNINIEFERLLLMEEVH